MNTKTQRKKKERREGAAMLIVLMVLTMTTATATFAMHSTSVEMRAAGHARQAMQAEYLAEGGTYAAIGYVEHLGAGGSLVQYLRTSVDANQASSPTEATVDQETNLLRIEMNDLAPALGTNGPAVETEVLRTPSFGPQNAYQPSFLVDGTDVYQLSRDTAGHDLSGRGARFYRMSLTSRGQMSLPTDFRATGDDRDFHETAMRARALVEVGPYFIAGH